MAQASATVVDDGAERAKTLERLRLEIQRVQAAPRQLLAELRSGLAGLDALHLWQLGTVVELCGEAASGRTSLALRAVAAAAQETRLSAWVDGPRELYPPAAAALGVDLARLLVVRPREPGRLVWSATQLARSGAFACVVADFTHTGVRLSGADARKLAEAARKGGTLLLLLTSPGATAQGLCRLEVRPAAAPEEVPAPAPTPPVVSLDAWRRRDQGGATAAAEGVDAAGPGVGVGSPARAEVAVAEPPRPAGGLCFELEVARSRQGGFGRVLRFEVAALQPTGAAPLRRARRLPLDRASGRLLETLPGHFERPRKNAARDGHGFYGTRPGRDGPWLSFSPALRRSGGRRT